MKLVSFLLCDKAERRKNGYITLFGYGKRVLEIKELPTKGRIGCLLHIVFDEKDDGKHLIEIKTYTPLSVEQVLNFRAPYQAEAGKREFCVGCDLLFPVDRAGTYHFEALVDSKRLMLLPCEANLVYDPTT